METHTLTIINPSIPLSLWQNCSPILQAAVKSAASIQHTEDIVDRTTEPKIATLQKKGGRQSTFGIVKALLIAMNSNLHIDNSLTEANINNIARELTSNNEIRYWLTLADIDLLCRQIVQGRFGKFYGHFSEQEFNDCLIRYCNHRRELHSLQADKDVSSPDTEVLHEVGYSVGKDGRLIVPLDVQKKTPCPQPMYIYDDHGRRRRNPRFHDPNENPGLRTSVRIYRRAIVIQDERQCPWPDALAAAKQEHEQQLQKNQ